MSMQCFTIILLLNFAAEAHPKSARRWSRAGPCPSTASQLADRLLHGWCPQHTSLNRAIVPKGDYRCATHRKCRRRASAAGRRLTDLAQARLESMHVETSVDSERSQPGSSFGKLSLDGQPIADGQAESGSLGLPIVDYEALEDPEGSFRPSDCGDVRHGGDDAHALGGAEHVQASQEAVQEGGVNSTSTHAKRTVRLGDWFCRNCGKFQFGRNLKCRACGLSQESHLRGKEIKEGDWICHLCGDHQFAKNVQCRKCGNIRDQDKAVVCEAEKPRNWICQKCGDVQFAKNVACRKCGAPKGSAMDTGGERASHSAQQAGVLIPAAGTVVNGQGQPGMLVPAMASATNRAGALLQESADMQDAYERGYDRGFDRGYERGFEFGYRRGYADRALEFGATRGDMLVTSSLQQTTREFVAPVTSSVEQPHQELAGTALATAKPMQQAMPSQLVLQKNPQAPQAQGSGRHGSQHSLTEARPGDWLCERCGDLQFAKNVECRKCGEPRKPTVRPIDSAAAGTKRARDAEQTLRAGDWWCDSCGDHQFATRRECRSCGKPKPAANAMPNGDWACQACGDIQFKKRTQCRLCGAPRPQALWETYQHHHVHAAILAGIFITCVFVFASVLISSLSIGSKQ
eukprot:gnl/TRDRNA2_/TRDRNA2_84748_c0_seq1.p1 gnl/TRDRNA2_/TRDRNA2_84748_c0~~gnl/TRDRNA2_/TRDRNA2_84748_c0_seq1.p1  ORF type:complete len:631 (+),score=77.73 gnl/TRDRNA2_/TRDRNA2_84748_c0_seq1:58-1950(+)